MTSPIHLQLASVLESFRRTECLSKAKEFRDSQPTSLHFRSLNLSEDEVMQIAAIFLEHKTYSNIQSVSFSYNTLTETGIKTLLPSLPISLRELGLVSCGLQNASGLYLFSWLTETSNLNMICAEGNTFSSGLKLKFYNFIEGNSKTTIYL